MHIGNIPREVDVGYPFAVAAVAFWRGGRCERAMAAWQAVLTFTGAFDLWRAMHGLHGFPGDLICLAACLTCVLHGRGYWAIWACATTVLSIVTDLIYFTVPGIGLWAFMSAEWVYSYALTTAILWGAITYRSGSGVARASAAPLAGLSTG
jgi:hypothetical protein